MPRPGDVPSLSARRSCPERLQAHLPAGALSVGREAGVKLTPVPEALARPADTAAVQALLAAARAEGVPVVVAGRASRLRTCGALPRGGYLALSTAALAGVREIEPASLWLRAGAGTPLEEIVARSAERELRPVGVEPDDPGSLGGFLARAARLPDAITGLDQPAALAVEGVLADGTPLASVVAPRTACGPELAALLLGHGGAFGVITAARIKLEPLPGRRLLLGLALRDPAAALELFRDLPLYDLPPRRAELELTPGREARLLVGFEGEAELASRALDDLRRASAAAGARVVELEHTRDWVGEGGEELGPEAWAGYGRLAAVLSAPARLDRPGLHGCRLRLRGPAGAAVAKALEPDGRRAHAVADERELLGRLRARLDPQGLLNDHAWRAAEGSG